MELKEINTLGELMRAIAQANFGGYDTMDVEVTQDSLNPECLIVKVSHISSHDKTIIENYTGFKLFGEFWFWSDDTVVQVL